jgi:hypothetical protein
VTQPLQEQTVNAHKGWNYLTHWLGSNAPFQLTHGGNVLRSVWAQTSKRGK